MKVILKENVKLVGNLGEMVNVSPGYARNFLMPRNLAIIADSSQKKAYEDYKKALSKKIEAEKKVALDLKTKIEAITLELIRKVGSNGRLFGSITTMELADELVKKGFTNIDRRQITLDRPIKQLGTYEARIKIFTEVEAKLPIKVEIDPISAEELKKAQKDAAERKKKEKKEQEDAAKKAELEAAELAKTTAEE